MLIWELVDIYLLLDRYNFLAFFFYLLSEPPHLSKLSKAHAKHIMYFSYKNQCLRMCFFYQDCYRNFSCCFSEPSLPKFLFMNKSKNSLTYKQSFSLIIRGKGNLKK